MAQNKRETLRCTCAELRGLLETIERAAAGLPEQDLTTAMKNIWNAKEAIEGAAECCLQGPSGGSTRSTQDQGKGGEEPENTEEMEEDQQTLEYEEPVQTLVYEEQVHLAPPSCRPVDCRNPPSPAVLSFGA